METYKHFWDYVGKPVESITKVSTERKTIRQNSGHKIYIKTSTVDTVTKYDR